jgi:oxygen-independent coproporphyrinogen-3 oxidase
MLELPPLSLYIHIPWCVKKCPYCDFNSHVTKNDLPEKAYVATLLQDLQNEAELAQGRKLISIFFGGGTPSLFSAVSIETIINAAQQIIGIADHAEITLEANPGTFEQEKFKDFRSCGVNRLSIGVQSFNDDHLKSLGRIHSSAEAIRAVGTAQQVGFDNINLDLMHGLPEQTPSQALTDIQQAVKLKPAHLSWYQLTIEPNTAFYSSPPVVPDEQQLEDILQCGLAALLNAGFEQYEISAFARTNKQAVHNNNYWHYGDYLGIGAGAHSKITWPKKQQITRYNKTRAPQHYLNRKGNFLAGTRNLKSEELAVEFFMNALRLSNGVPIKYLSQRGGINFAVIAEIWEELVCEGLTSPPGDTLVATTKGQQFLNTILTRF